MLPVGDAGEWLQQYVWALEDSNLEAAGQLLAWILERGESWIILQAGQCSVDRLERLPDGKGLAATLIRFYHVLGPLLPELHAFHTTFLKRIDAHIRSIQPGVQSLPVIIAIDRALELFHASLSHRPGYAQLRERLSGLIARSRTQAQQEQETELQALVVAGELNQALELGRELMERYDSPTAASLLPSLELRARQSAADRTRKVRRARPAREWEWPDESHEEVLDGLYDPHRRRPSVIPEVVPPNAAWSRAFEAPPPPSDRAARDAAARTSPDASSAGGREPITREITFGGALDPDRSMSSSEGSSARSALPDLRSLTAMEDERTADRATASDGAASGSGRLPRTADRARLSSVSSHPASLPSALNAGALERFRAAPRWIWALAILLVAGGVALYSMRNRTGAPAIEANQTAPAQPHATAVEASRPIEPPMPSGPPSALTLKVTPADRLELYIDGQLVPDGVISRATIPAGSHLIEIYREGYEAHRATVETKESQHLETAITLQRSPAMSVFVSPSDALDIRLNGQRLQDTTPIRNYFLTPGSYRLEVSRNGFRPHVEQFEARLGDRVNFNILLKPSAH